MRAEDVLIPDRVADFAHIKKNTYTIFSIFISRWLPRKRWLVCVWLALTLVLDLNFGRVTCILD